MRPRAGSPRSGLGLGCSAMHEHKEKTHQWGNSKGEQKRKVKSRSKRKVLWKLK